MYTSTVKLTCQLIGPTVVVSQLYLVFTLGQTSPDALGLNTKSNEAQMNSQ